MSTQVWKPHIYRRSKYWRVWVTPDIAPRCFASFKAAVAFAALHDPRNA